MCVDLLVFEGNLVTLFFRETKRLTAFSGPPVSTHSHMDGIPLSCVFLLHCYPHVCGWLFFLFISVAGCNTATNDSFANTPHLGLASLTKVDRLPPTPPPPHAYCNLDINFNRQTFPSSGGWRSPKGLQANLIPTHVFSAAHRWQHPQKIPRERYIQVENHYFLGSLRMDRPN